MAASATTSPAVWQLARRADKASRVETVMMTDSVSWEMNRHPQRPWWEKWMLVLRLHQQLQELYRPHASCGSLDPVRSVDEFFIECWSLHDWLKNDGTEAPRIDDAALAPIRSDPDLQIGRAHANMAKHLERERPSELRARVRNVRMRDGSVQVDIEYWNNDPASPHNTPSCVDALALATRCVDVWKRFLATHRLSPP